MGLPSFNPLVFSKASPAFLAALNAFELPWDAFSPLFFLALMLAHYLALFRPTLLLLYKSIFYDFLRININKSCKKF